MLRAVQLAQKNYTLFRSLAKLSFSQRLQKINQENVEMPASFYCAISFEFSNNPVMFNQLNQQLVDKAIAEECRIKSSKCPFTNDEILSINPHNEKIAQISKFIHNLERIYRLEEKLIEETNKTLKNLEELIDSFTDEEFLCLKNGQLLSVSKPITEQIIEELNYHIMFIESIFDAESLQGDARKNESERVSTPYYKKLAHYTNGLNHAIDMDQPYCPQVQDALHLAVNHPK